MSFNKTIKSHSSSSLDIAILFALNLVEDGTFEVLK